MFLVVSGYCTAISRFPATPVEASDEAARRRREREQHRVLQQLGVEVEHRRVGAHRRRRDRLARRELRRVAVPWIRAVSEFAC